MGVRRVFCGAARVGLGGMARTQPPICHGYRRFVGGDAIGVDRSGGGARWYGHDFDGQRVQRQRLERGRVGVGGGGRSYCGSSGGGLVNGDFWRCMLDFAGLVVGKKKRA